LLAGVGAEDVRDVLHVSDADIPDAKVLKMVKRAEVTLELEISENIDYADCTEPAKEAITLLAAIYAVCYLTGGSAIGLNYSLGDLTSSTAALASLGVLQTTQSEKLIRLNRRIALHDYETEIWETRKVKSGDGNKKSLDIHFFCYLIVNYNSNSICPKLLIQFRVTSVNPQTLQLIQFTLSRNHNNIV
jgi:hypothetical protein